MGDCCFLVQQGVNYSIQNGCDLSRSRILTFKHNDVADLERIMEMVAAEDTQLG
jgi:serine palmitoyltransferase